LNLAPLFAAGLLAAASSDAPVNTPHPHASTRNNVLSVATVVPESHRLPAAPVAGDAAPDFSYQSNEYLWQSLHNMLEQGHVLLVFGASDDQLRSLERSREDLLHRGVVPVAVMERRDGDVWAIVRRLNLTYSLLADPHAAIAEQYGVLDPATHRSRPTWFVIDRQGHVRGTGQGVEPSRDWAQMAISALGLTDVKSATTR